MQILHVLERDKHTISILNLKKKIIVKKICKKNLNETE